MLSHPEGGCGYGQQLGLHPFTARLSLIEHMRLADDPAASFLNSTPSLTSEFSSDLDTESTGSFFPETSTSLGRLIGIRSNTQIDESQGGVTQLLEVENSKKRGTVRHRLCCPFLGCAGSDACEETMSPSLGHFLELERNAALSQGHEISESLTDEDGFTITEQTLNRNTLFDDDCILPPQQSGAPLKLMLEQTRPNSSYLSADWAGSIAVFNSTNRTLPHEKGDQANRGPFPTFWPSICGRLRTGLAG